MTQNDIRMNIKEAKRLKSQVAELQEKLDAIKAELLAEAKARGMMELTSGTEAVTFTIRKTPRYSIPKEVKDQYKVGETESLVMNLK